MESGSRFDNDVEVKDADHVPITFILLRESQSSGAARIVDLPVVLSPSGPPAVRARGEDQSIAAYH